MEEKYVEMRAGQLGKKKGEPSTVGPRGSSALLGKSRKLGNWERKTLEDRIKKIMQNREEEIHFLSTSVFCWEFSPTLAKETFRGC